MTLYSVRESCLANSTIREPIFRVEPTAQLYIIGVDNEKVTCFRTLLEKNGFG